MPRGSGPHPPSPRTPRRAARVRPTRAQARANGSDSRLLCAAIAGHGGAKTSELLATLENVRAFRYPKHRARKDSRLAYVPMSQTSKRDSRPTVTSAHLSRFFYLVHFGAYWCIIASKQTERSHTCPRLSNHPLTDSQAAALESIAAETGATKQSMIGTCYYVLDSRQRPFGRRCVKPPEIASQEPEDTTKCEGLRQSRDLD